MEKVQSKPYLTQDEDAYIMLMTGKAIQKMTGRKFGTEQNKVHANNALLSVDLVEVEECIL